MNHKLTLHILLVLTFIYAGLSTLSYFAMGAMLPSLQQYYETHTDLFPDEIYTMMTIFFEMPREYFIIAALIYLLEIVGAALMWNIRRSGFHCYTIARLLLLLVPLLFLGRGSLGIGDIMMAALFVLVYWLLLKQLGAFGEGDREI